MPLDPIARAWLDAAAAGALPVGEATPQALRDARVPPPAGPEVERVRDMQVAGPDGPIPVRLYSPSAEPDLPILVWYHGGGWVTGSIDIADPTARRLCNLAQCIVISVGYRLAPEHPYPAPRDDAYAAVVWAFQNAKRFGGDSERIAIGGDSAGGTLAAAVAQMVRDRAGIPLRLQLLVYPVTDASMSSASFEELGAFGLTRHDMAWYWDQYAPPGVDRDDPYLSPTRATNLERLAPAYVITAEYDPLCAEGEAYADALRAAGVPVELERYDGQIHAFFVNAHAFPEGMRAVEAAAARLRAAFTRQ